MDRTVDVIAGKTVFDGPVLEWLPDTAIVLAFEAG